MVQYYTTFYFSLAHPKGLHQVEQQSISPYKDGRPNLSENMRRPIISSLIIIINIK